MYGNDYFCAMKLKEFASIGCVPVTYNDIIMMLEGYRAPKNKVQSLERKGILVRLKKGLYVVSSEVSGREPVPELIANHLHAPSYVSRYSALRLYGLIPERVVNMQSMTTGRTCEFETPLGRYSYIRVPVDYFAIGITTRMEHDVSFLIATPEKALCDIIVSTSMLRPRYLTGLRTWLEEDLRIDMEAFYAMQPDIFEKCAPYIKKSQTLLNLAKLIKHDNL